MTGTRDLDALIGQFRGAVLQQIELADISDVALTKPVAEVPDADVDAALLRMASGNRSYTSKGEKAKAEAPKRQQPVGKKRAKKKGSGS